MEEAPDHAHTNPEEEQIDNNQFVTFSVGGEMFAVPMAPVQEIIRVPDVVKVPLSPVSLCGLANLRGKVLPVIALRTLFGHAKAEYDDATRVLVIQYNSSLGFVVDRVLSVIGVEEEDIEPVSTIQGTVHSEFLSGVIKPKHKKNGQEHHKASSSSSMLMVLDFSKLIEKEFSEIGFSKESSSRDHFSLAAMTSSHSGEEDDENSDELQLVSFEVAHQEYAIAIEQVQEIVQIPENIIHIPNAESHVLGLMSLRNRLLPLVSLRQMFSLPADEISERHRIMVVSLGKNQSVGIVMDAVNEVLRVLKSDVEALPELFSRHHDLKEIDSICRLNGGKRLVSIISSERLFAHQSVRDALTALDQTTEEGDMTHTSQTDDTEDESNDDELQVVVFRLGDEEFGVPIESVQEIVRVPDELTHVPKAPDFVEGVINLRGTVLPVIDQRRRFGMEDAERNDRQRIMVYLFEGTRTGFVVDSVAEVLKIPRSCIAPSPHLSAEQSRLISMVANLEKAQRLIMLIDYEKLLDSVEIKALEVVG